MFWNCRLAVWVKTDLQAEMFYWAIRGHAKGAYEPVKSTISITLNFTE